LKGAQVEIFADAGAYAYTTTMVLPHAALTSAGVYAIPSVQVDAYAVCTNNVPAGAFRGFGSPQGAFAAVQQMDRLAGQIGLDPVTIRERNLLRPGDPLCVGAQLPDSIHLDRVLEECARAAGWRRVDAPVRRWEPPAAAPEQASPGSTRRGNGIALGMKNIGFSFGYPEESTATIELYGEAEIEEVVLRFAGAECGQGVQTVMIQMAAEALDVSPAIVRLVGADTALSPEAGSASASRLTLMGGNAVIGAAREALARWRNEERPATATYTHHAPLTTAPDPSTGQMKPHVVFSPVAQAAQVEVDIATGQVSVRKLITAVDVGQAVNPAQVEGQVQGAVAQGLGYAILENFIARDGRILTPNLSTYLIPTVLDMPETCASVVVEHPDPLGPWGARGMGESPIVAVAPAVVSALHDASGVWCDELPLTPQRVLAGLRSAQI
jgi:CO/xanthine dehydrogenase Mo-binding subunit